MFPIADRQGRIIAFGGRTLGQDTPKYLNSPETPLFHKGQELYNLHRARQSLAKEAGLIVVEGYMDVIALVQAGINNVVATLGTALTTDHLRRLLHLSPQLFFCFDGDQAGRAAAWRALETLLPTLQDGVSAKFIFLPAAEDPDSYVRKHGQEGFREALKNAWLVSDFLFDHLTRSLNLAQVEDRAKLNHQVLPLIAKLPEGAMRPLLLEKLASITRLKVTRLPLPGEGERRPPVTWVKSAPLKPQPLSPLRLAAVLLMQNPALIQELNDIDFIAGLNLTGKDIFLQIVEILRQNPIINVGGLIELCRGHPQESIFLKLANYAHLIPAEGIPGEFRAAIARLAQIHQEQVVEGLLAKLAAQGLTEEERRRLNQLLMQRSVVSE
jgi:DNA primase